MRVIFLILIWFSSLSFAEFTTKNGVVRDSTTKLEWQDDYSDNGGDIKSTTWQSALEYCEASSLDGGEWRLPNIRELTSLVEVDDIEFISYKYWSSTTVAGTYRNNYAWVLSFFNNFVYNESKNNDYYVRCVRAGE